MAEEENEKKQDGNQEGDQEDEQISEKIDKESPNALLEHESPIWRIKYRPKSIEDLKRVHIQLAEELRGFIKARNMPHIMLVGPEGAGKSTIAEILARELLGEEFKMNFKLLYADDPISKEERDEAKRQTRVSSNRIGSGAGQERRSRPFIQLRVRPFVASQKFGGAPFKVLAIKNFHQLDVEQQAFRRIMEQYSSNCRMVLITDRISGIIDPIISRCQLIMLPQVSPHLFNRHLKTICDTENVKINLDVLNSVRHMSRANLGKALDLLQLSHLRFNEMNLDNITKMSHELRQNSVRELFTKALEGNMVSIRKTLRDIFQANALSKNEIFIELNRLITHLPLERTVRAFFIELIAQADFDAIDSNDDEIQITNLLAKMALVGREVR